MLRTIARVLACASLAAALGAPARAQTPAPAAAFAPMPEAALQTGGAPLPMPAACGVAQTMSLAEAFGRPIDDVASLRFVALVRSLPADRLQAVANYRYDGAFFTRVADAATAGCTGALGSVTASRAFPLAPALAPFGTVSANLGEDDPPPSGPVTCTHPGRDASVTNAAVPAYPKDAQQQRGTVKVVVALERHGFVRYVRTFTSDLKGVGSFENASIVAAGDSDYAAAREACRPLGGAFLFVSTFAPPNASAPAP